MIRKSRAASRAAPEALRRRRSAREPAWLLLIHQLPTRPSNVRVRTWRRLQDVGAVGVKNSVYVLPNSAQAREDLEWIKGEVVAMKGQASVFAADSVDSMSHDEIVAAFRRARQKDFEAIRRDAGKLLAGSVGKRAVSGPVRRRLASRTHQLREQWNRIVSRDFFGAAGREEAGVVLDELEQRLARQAPVVERDGNGGTTLRPGSYRKRLWVTRPRPGIDRMASAWLIRRFIDPRARFGFVERAGDIASAIPFDMYGVEFSHQGANCTFETLVERFGLKGRSLGWLGRVVHNLDLKDDRYAVPEAPAIGMLVDGLRQLHSDDQVLLESGITMFEALHRSCSAGGAAARRKRKSPARPKKRKAGKRGR